jgi:hypothetical protein
MKVYTLGIHGFAPPDVANMLGLDTAHRQAEILVAAPTKAEAYALLAARHMAPSTIRDPHFRVATGVRVDLLERLRMFDAPVVYALKNSTAATPVVRVVRQSTPVVIGRLEPAPGQQGGLRFVPTMAGVDGPIWDRAVTVAQLCRLVDDRCPQLDLAEATELVTEALHNDAVVMASYDSVAGPSVPLVLAAVEAELEQRLLRAADAGVQVDLVEACTANEARVKQLNDEVKVLHAERRALAERAVRENKIPEVAAALNVSPNRVYQLRDEHLVRAAREKSTAR